MTSTILDNTALGRILQRRRDRRYIHRRIAEERGIAEFRASDQAIKELGLDAGSAEIRRRYQEILSAAGHRPSPATDQQQATDP